MTIVHPIRKTEALRLRRNGWSFHSSIGSLSKAEELAAFIKRDNPNYQTRILSSPSAYGNKPFQVWQRKVRNF